MPVTLDSLDALKARHLHRFASVEQQGGKLSKGAGLDLLTVLRKLHSGSPTGPLRIAALKAADYPFALRHGWAQWPTPPVGVITGALLASLQAPVVLDKPGVWGISGKSVGVNYAQYLWSPRGTIRMVPRGVDVAIQAYSMTRVVQLGRDLMTYQLSLL